MSGLYPNTPGMVADLPPRSTPPGQESKPSAPAPAQPPASKESAPNLHPNTPDMRGDDGKPLAPEQPAEVSRADGEPGPDPAVLAVHYPIEFADDFIPHEPAVTAFRALAAKHKLSPAVAQELAAFHVAELRRLAEIPDPAERARTLYPATPGMRP